MTTMTPNPGVQTAHGTPRFGSGFYTGDANDWSFDDGDGAGDLGDDGQGDGGRDSKRRRIARACDMCRKKKIKCDGKAPKCGHCENYKTECVFTQVEKKRNPPKGAKYIEGLENRLGRMESLLRLSGLLAEDDGGRTDLGTLERRLAERSQSIAKSNVDSPASPTEVRAALLREGMTPDSNSSRGTSERTPMSNVTSPDPTRPKHGSKEVDVLADQMCSLITNNCGETRYIGSSSGFSIFSPKGVLWVNEKTGDSSFQQMITSASGESGKFDHWKPEVFSDLFARRVFKPLPNKQECYALMRDYFQNFNSMFPLFHEPTFMHLVDKHYSLEPYEGSGWWASLNVALAIAARMRVMSNVVCKADGEAGWGYLKNALAVLSELTMRNTDLLSVQALLGMALYLQGTPNPQPSFFLAAAAVRLSHSIGLHKRGSGFNLNDAESEQRKRVFWIAYQLDKDLCLRSGRPPAQDDDDMNVDLPSEDPPDHVGVVILEKPLPDGRKTVNLFRQMCTFAQIQSKVYKQLYTVKASRQSDGELLNTIGELDSMLEEWKNQMPLDFRPEHEIKASSPPLMLHVAVLHFAYYNCLTTIHRMSVHHGYWTSRLSEFAIQGLNARPLNPRVFMSAALCVNAARTSIGLIRYIPQGDYACVWLILYYPVSSLVTLFANILQNPQDARARSDLKLMSSVVNFLAMVSHDSAETTSSVTRMLSVCSEFERIARVALDKAEREMKGRGKKRQAEREMEKERAKDNAVAEIVDGKSLMQLQAETQAPYRHSLQQGSGLNLMAGPNGAGTKGSPTPWNRDKSQSNLGNSSEVGAIPPVGAEAYTATAQASNGAWQSSPYGMPGAPSQNRNAPYTPGWPTTATPQASQQPVPYLGSSNIDFGAGSSFQASPDVNRGPDSVDLNEPFQQPFVPQDLWQMPMTLEWDWAEGLGNGTFTPGPLLDGMVGFMDGLGQNNNPQG